MKDKIWDMIHDLLPEEYQKRICLYEETEPFETDIKDIIDNIERLATEIELKIDEKATYEAERRKGEDD